MDYVVKFPWNGYNRIKYAMIENWCIETLGAEYVQWVGFTTLANEFTFLSEEAKMLFLLRWGHEIPQQR